MGVCWLAEAFPNFDILSEYKNLSEGKKIYLNSSHIDSKNEHICIFCGKTIGREEKKDIAHAIPECVGNKSLFNKCECYECNHLFGEIIEDNLGKYIMPYKFVTDVYGKGKKNIVKDMPQTDDISYNTYRFEASKNGNVFKSETFDVHKMLIERNESDLLQFTEEGFRLKIPRQKYDSVLVYIAFLRMAYSIMPIEEIPNVIKGITAMRLSLKMKYNDENSESDVNENDFLYEKYIKSLPSIGIEITDFKASLNNTVDVCLMKSRTCEEPKYLFGLQLKYYSIIVPIMSDSFVGGDYRVNPIINGNSKAIRRLDFTEPENEFIADFNASKIEIPSEIFDDLETDLRESKLLRKK